MTFAFIGIVLGGYGIKRKQHRLLFFKELGVIFRSFEADGYVGQGTT